MSSKRSFEQFSSTAAKGSIGTEYISYCRRRLLNEYFPKIERCLDNLSDDDVWWRAHEANNSIGNLILHLSGNVRQWIVSGLGGEKDVRNRPSEFTEREKIPKQRLVSTLRSTLEDADRVLGALEPVRLLEVHHIQQYDTSRAWTRSHTLSSTSLNILDKSSTSPNFERALISSSMTCDRSKE